MIAFERTNQAALIRAIFSHAFPTLEQERGAGIFRHFARENECILARADGDLVGLYMLCGLNEVLCEIHFALLPQAWGTRGLAISRAFLAWFWQNTGYERLIGNIDSGNCLALRFVERLGFRVFGVNERAMRKHGELIDAVMVGVTRGKT